MARTKVQSELIATNAISGTIIADNAITATHIATNAISGTLVQSSGITTDMIASNNVTAAKIVSDGIETRHLHSNVISGQSSVTAASGDYVLIGDTSDSNNLKKALVSDLGNDLDAAVTINESGAAVDFRVEGDTEQNLFFVDGSADKIGIGTATPSTIFNISDTAPILRIDCASNQDSKILFAENNNTAVSLFYEGSAGTGTDNNLHIRNELSGSEANLVTFGLDGKVGIGQTAPASTLHIGDGASHYVRIENAGSGDVSSGYQIYRGSSIGMSLYDNPQDNTTSLLCAGSLNINAGGSGADLHVNTNGKVGIGTTSPDDLLDIMGGGYDQIRIGSNKTDNTNKTAGIVSTMYTNNSVSFMQGFFQNGNNAVYYGSADGAHRGLQNHYFYVNSNYNATSGHTLAMRINSSGQMTRPTHPAFHAYGPTSAANAAYLVFQNTTVNTGSHYSTSTGKFTAPVAGVYSFHWSAIANNTNDVYRYFLRVNQSSTISGTGNDVHLRIDTSGTGSEYGTNGSRVQIISLSASDEVQIYYAADGGSTTYVASDYVNFGGYLIG